MPAPFVCATSGLDTIVVVDGPPEPVVALGIVPEVPTRACVVSTKGKSVLRRPTVVVLAGVQLSVTLVRTGVDLASTTKKYTSPRNALPKLALMMVVRVLLFVVLIVSRMPGLSAMVSAPTKGMKTLYDMITAPSDECGDKGRDCRRRLTTNRLMRTKFLGTRNNVAMPV